MSAFRRVRAVGTHRPSSLNTRTPGGDHLADLGEDLALEALRDRPDREDVGEAGAGGRGPDLARSRDASSATGSVFAIGATAV